MICGTEQMAAITLALACGICGACAKDEGGSAAAPPVTASATIPASFALASEPEGAKPVKEIVASAKSGDDVVAVGRVGIEGTEESYFALVDRSLKPCTDMGDECKTPWDYCCTAPDEMAKLSATVEFRDATKRYAGSALGFHGLDHLKEVVVKGKAKKDSAGNLTIVASGIWVKP